MTADISIDVRNFQAESTVGYAMHVGSFLNWLMDGPS